MKHKVLIMRCREYDPGIVSGIIREGMQELGVKPSGRILLKPNTVIAHRELFPHAFTRSEFLDGVISAVKDRAEHIEEIAVGERSGITVPTRFCFRNADYNRILKKHRIKAYYFDEERHVTVKLKEKDRLRDEIYIPRPVTSCDFLINLPKFKAHPWTGITLSLKNYIGLQDDRHRLVDHNSYLEHKIADLQEVVKSRFIAVDAITAGQKMMLTPDPFDMGAIIMGTNSCAVDAVGCYAVNLDPSEIKHIKMASGRGHGPVDIDEVDISGDFPLEEIQNQNRDFQFCLERIDKYFNGKSNITCSVGDFPEDHSSDYCWGGCPGALQEAMHIFKSYNENVLSDIKKIRYVAGHVHDELDIDDGERIIFAGDCTEWSGKIDSKHVKIDPAYINKESVDIHKRPSGDMLLKIFSSLFHCLRNRKKRYIRAKGCPVSVAEHVNYIASVGGIGNVNFDRCNIFQVNIAYWQMRFMRIVKRLLG